MLLTSLMQEKKMMKNYISLQYCQVVCLALCCLLCYSGFGHALERAMYLFGSSVLDIGNNNYIPNAGKANFYPYGIDYPGGKATGRFTNGKNTADFLVELLGVASPKASLSINNTNNMVEEFLRGANFASGGAGVLDTTFKGTTMPLSQQIGLFEAMVVATIEKIGMGRTYEHMTKSYIVIFIGNNDITLGTGDDPEKYASLLISTLRPLLKNVYKFGGRRFVTISSGAQGCLPALRAALNTSDCYDHTNSLAKAYNRKLASLMRALQLESNSGDLHYSYFDLLAAHFKLYANRKVLGFSEVETACCGSGQFNGSSCLPGTVPCSNRSNHIYWDGAHYTERFTEMYVKLAFHGSAPYVQPINVKQLSELPV